MDDTGRHAVLVSRRGAQETNEATAQMRAFKANFALRDPRLLDPVREFPGDATVVMQTLWPNLIVQQQSNTLAMRQIVPLDARSFDLAWTFFGYADDTPEMRQRRLRQANLMGPAGLVSLDDSEAMLLSQAGIDGNDDADLPRRDGRPRRDQRAAHGDRDRDPRLLPALSFRHGAVTRHDRRRAGAGCRAGSAGAAGRSVLCLRRTR